MDQNNTSSAAVTITATEVAERKAKRNLMGKLDGPITAVRVLRKDQSHDFGGKAAVSWAVVTPGNQLVKATTYGGALGKGFLLGEHNTVAMPADGSKDQRKALKGYNPVTSTSEYPAFVVAVSSIGDQDNEQEQDNGDQGDQEQDNAN